MITHSPVVKTEAEQFLLTYIASLLDYAAAYPDFAQTLAMTHRQLSWKTTSPAPRPLTASRFLYPADQSDAVVTARWILQTVQTHPEYQTARGILQQWADTYESPKDLVLGIVGLAIIGPTLGLIDSKKKKKRKSQLVIEQTYFDSLDKRELALLTTQLSQAVIGRELKYAAGNVYNLHPDTAAWCLEEALTQLYVDSATNLSTLLETVRAEKLSHTVQRDADDSLQVLTISPSVNDTLVDESNARSL